MNIGAQIKFLRRKKHITQEELAKILGVSNQAVSKWEKGLSFPSITLLPAIAEYFDVTIDSFFASAANIDGLSERGCYENC